MNFLKAGLVVVVLAVGAGAFFLERQSTDQLRGEIALLRAEVQQLASQRAQARNDENKATVGTDLAQTAQQQADRAEIARLRDELNTVKARTQEMAQKAEAVRAAIANQKSSVDDLPVKLIPVNDWKNAGRETTKAAVETVLWAAVGGDVDLLAGSVEFTPSAREKAMALLNNLPAATRAQYDTPEKLMALMIAKDADRVAGLQVLGEREISPDNVGMRLRFGSDDGKTKEQSFLMHHSADGWRLMLTDAPVEKFAKQLSQGGGGK